MAETGNAYHKLSSGAIQKLQDLANQLRIHSIQATSASNSGHPTSCCSMAEIMSVLFFHTMKYKVSEPKDPANDRFILSKGHAAPILYAAWAEAGLFPKEDLLNLRKISSDLEGHPTPRLNFVDVATGSLGQGLSCAAGMAYVGKYLDKADYRVYCLLGDGESAEGSVWEAMAFAHHYKLNNLVAIFDVNRLGQSEATMLKHNLEDYRRRAEAFGFKAIIVDGHDVSALVKAFDEAAASSEQPVAIIAQTFKGKNIPDAEDKDNCHGKPMGKATDSSIQHINSLINNTAPHGITPASPTKSVSPPSGEKIALCDVPQYKLGDNIATRLAYGTALVKIGKNHQQVIALDGDTKNSTFSQKFRDAYPERFIECFIAEQNMVGVAVGAGCRDRTVPFVSTFAAFLTRGFDQIRMAAVSQTNINLCGSHCGVSIGADGPSQMALEDLAMFRTVPNCTVFYPSDAVSTERAVELAANTRGMCFIRTTRANTPVIYGNDDKFEIGKCKVVEQSDSDQVTVIGAGITLLEARKASEQLKQEGIRVRIVDPFTIKPIDAVGIRDAVRSTAGRVVTVEDHYAEGGIGEAVAGCLSEERDLVIHRLHVTDVPRSGEPQELLEMFGIDSTAIVNAVKQTIKL